MTDLGTLGGKLRARPRRSTTAARSSAASFDRIRGEEHAFLWQDGAMTDLGTLGGGASGAAPRINDRGQVVGRSRRLRGPSPRLPLAGRRDDRSRHARRTSERGHRHQRPGPGRRLRLRPRRVATHAFLWQDGAMTDLGTLGGRASWAYAINDRGQVVGAIQMPPRRMVVGGRPRCSSSMTTSCGVPRRSRDDSRHPGPRVGHLSEHLDIARVPRRDLIRPRVPSRAD